MDNMVDHKNSCKNCIASKKVGSVTPEERDEIKSLFERKNGLTELFRSLVTIDKEELENSNLYEKIVIDMGKVSTKFQKWWTDKSTKYQWENIAGYQWEIDFDSCDVYLKKQ